MTTSAPFVIITTAEPQAMWPGRKMHPALDPEGILIPVNSVTELVVEDDLVSSTSLVAFDYPGRVGS